MKKLLFLFSFLYISYSVPAQNIEDKWKLFAVTEGEEVYIDTTGIKQIDNPETGTFRYRVSSKKIYTEAQAKEKYLGKIEIALSKTEKKQSKIQKKMKKWEDFQYTIIEYIYDCANRRYKIAVITDYNSKNKKIVTTKTSKNSPWVNIIGNDVADLMLFHVCDSEQ